MHEHNSQTDGKGPEKTQRNSCVNQTGRVAHTQTHTPTKTYIHTPLRIPLTFSLTGVKSPWQAQGKKKNQSRGTKFFSHHKTLETHRPDSTRYAAVKS